VDVYQYGLLNKFTSHLYDPFGIRFLYELATNPEKIKNPGGQPNLNEFYAEGEWETISINGGSILHDGTYQSEEGGGVLDGGGGVTTDNLSSDRSESGGSEKTLKCPENTVKLSDDNDNIECVSCEVLHGDFNGALAGGDKEYAQSLAEFAPNCGWSKTASQRIRDAERCPGNTVKLSDNSGQNQCVPCDELYGDFHAALDSGDRDYAGTLAALGSSCGWSRSAIQQMNNANQQVELDQKCSQQIPDSHATINGDRYTCQCNAGMLQLNGTNGSSCQSCEHVRGLVNAALQRNDMNNVRGLMAGAQSCDWYDKAVQVVTKIEDNNNQQVELDQKCQEQILFSHAVISGNQYRCVCNDGRLIVNNSESSACQSCEQVRGMINAALQRNDINSATGLLGGAQSCGWYNEAVQVVANGKRNGQRKQEQDFQDLMHGIEGLTGQIINEYDRHNEKKPPTPEYNPKPPRPSSPPTTMKKPPTKPPPQKKQQSYGFKTPDCPSSGPRNKTINTQTSRCTYDQYGSIKNAYRKQ